MTYPYRDHSFAYLRAGWRGVLWLKPGTKWPPPAGYTGHEGAWPSPSDVQTWGEDHPDANLALRLPEDVLGLDVDQYAGKTGGDTLALMEANLGELPPTIVSSSRTDGVSGIRLYRCPPHPSWPNQAGPGIEMIHHGHRYAVAWPSLHPEGGTYRWFDQRTGEILDRPPRPDELPEMPEKWIVYLQAKAGTVADKADVADDDVSVWLRALRVGAACDKVTESSRDTLSKLAGGNEGRHDAMLSGSAALIGLGAWGHAGTAQALSDLYDAFITHSTKPGDGQRTRDQAHNEWKRAIGGAVAMHHTDRPQPAQVCSCPLPAFDPNVEEEFWEARPTLDHVRQFARARRTSPWAVLASVLSRMTVNVPPHYVLPAMIGGQASLNLFVGVVARSGGGKGAAEAAADDAVDVGEVHTSGVGSGEGILHQYVAYKPPKKEDPGGVAQHNDRVLFTAGEVDTLGALHARQSSTLLSELRKVYMGEELSFAYVDPTKRLKVKRHRYRACLIVGVQPSRAGVLLDDADGGTPQRFLWMPGTDRDMPDVAPDEPDPIAWECPRPGSGHYGHVVIDVCDTARDTIDEQHVKRNRGDGDALDGHALLTRLKWAAALGILDGRLAVSDEDWRLAGVVMEMSDFTRQVVIDELRARKAASNTAKGLADAERDVIREETVAEAGVKRVCRVLMRRLDGGERSRADLRKSVTSRDRGYFESAVERLVEAGQVTVIEDVKGTIYRASGRVA